jgi:hypothetical protein
MRLAMHLQAPQKTEKGSFALLGGMGGMVQILKWENYWKCFRSSPKGCSAVKFIFSREGGGKMSTAGLYTE